MTTQNLPEPVETPLSLPDALAFTAKKRRGYVTVIDTEPDMPGPWERRMQLRGAWIWVHPARMARDIAHLESLPPMLDEYEALY